MFHRLRNRLETAQAHPLWRVLWELKGVSAKLGTVSAVTALLNPVPAFALSQLINIYSGTEELSWSIALSYIGILVLASSLAIAFIPLQEHFELILSDRLEVRLGEEIQTGMKDTRSVFLQAEFGADADQVAREAVKELSLLAFFIPQLGVLVLSSITYLGVTYWIHPQLGVICTGMVLFCLVSTKFWKKYQKIAKQKFDLYVDLRKYMTEFFKKLGSVPNDNNPHLFQRYQSSAERIFAANRAMLVPRFLTGQFFTSLAKLISDCLIFLLGTMVYALPVGTIYQVWNYNSNVSSQMTSLFSQITRLLDIIHPYRQVKRLLAVEKHADKDQPDAQPLTELNTIAVEKLRGGYPEFEGDKQVGTTEILKRVSLTIQPGEFVALVGPSGSGKSTFVKALLNEVEITGGEILFNGRSQYEWTAASRRAAFGYCDQSPRIVAGTIRENLVNGHEIEDANIWEAIEQAGLTKDMLDVERFPEGLDTLIQEHELSGGQRTRIGIAHALLTTKDVLILDEPTAALDSFTEEIIRQTMDRLHQEGKTLLVVAHRLSTIQQADQVVFFRGGQIHEQGSFAELKQRGGQFFNYLQVQGL